MAMQDPHIMGETRLSNSQSISCMATFSAILRLWFVFNVLLYFVLGSFGFQEEEKLALLKLKHALNYPNGTALSSWGGDQEMDCCKWERVGCNELTRRVTNLSLNNTRPREFWEASLFLPFAELQELRLKGNFIIGFYGVLRSKKLQILDLSFNRLTEIPSLSGVESLKYLNCRLNELQNLSTSTLANCVPHWDITILGICTIITQLSLMFSTGK